MLRFTGYNKNYNGNLVIRVPDIELEQGIYWLKGENGSGKTTLIKSVAGLIPFNGTISVAGKDISKDRMAYRRLVNYAEAEPVYPVFLTGNDMVRFYLKAKGGREKETKEMMDALGVSGYANNKTGTYSSGMTKKLSLVLGFIGAPQLILLDEPLITLDHRSVLLLQELIEAARDSGISFIITSHQEISFPGHQSCRLEISGKTLIKTQAIS